MNKRTYANFGDGSAFLVALIVGIGWGWFNDSWEVGLFWGVIVFIIIGIFGIKKLNNKEVKNGKEK